MIEPSDLADLDNDLAWLQQHNPPRAMQPEDIGLTQAQAAPYAFVDCRNCGKTPMTEAQYTAQMLCPDRPWCCMRCGDGATFDDESFERIHGISEED